MIFLEGKDHVFKDYDLPRNKKGEGASLIDHSRAWAPRRIAVGCFSFLTLMGAAFAQPDAPRSHPVLQNIPSPGDATSATDAQFSLSLLPCKNKRCSYELRWGAADPSIEPASRLALDWAVSGTRAQAHAQKWESSYGAGEPLKTPGKNQPSIWSAGLEEGAVATSVWPLRLASQQGDETSPPPAVAVSQMAGYEHLKRQHAIYAVPGGQLRKLWSRREPAGPHMSWLMTPPDRAAIYLSVFLSPDSSSPDQLSARELIWDGARQSVFERAGATGLFGVVVGAFDSVAQARSAQSSACVAQYWVIDTQALKWPLTQRYVLLLPASTRAAADKENARLHQCSPDLSAKVRSLPRLPADSSTKTN